MKIMEGQQIAGSAQTGSAEAMSNHLIIPGLDEPVFHNGHQVKVSSTLEGVLKKGCKLCQMSMLPGTPSGNALLQRDCGHPLHSRCYFEYMRMTGRGPIECEHKCLRVSGDFESFDSICELVGYASKQCVEKECIYRTTRGGVDSQQANQCPYPESLFAPDTSAVGFLHANVDTVAGILDEYLSGLGFKYKKAEIKGFNQDELDKLHLEYGERALLDHGLEDLKSIYKTLVNVNNSVQKINQQSNSREDGTGPRTEPVTIPEVDHGLITQLIAQMQRTKESLVSFAESNPVLPASVSRYLKTDNNFLDVPGLASLPDKDIAITFWYKGMRSNIEFTLESKYLNDPDTSAVDSVRKIVGFVRCVLIAYSMRWNEPDFFMPGTETYLKLPFDYFNNQITVCNNSEDVAIPLDSVVNIEERSVNYSKLRKELENKGINYNSLGETKLDREYAYNSGFAPSRNNKYYHVIRDDVDITRAAFREPATPPNAHDYPVPGGPGAALAVNYMMVSNSEDSIAESNFETSTAEVNSEKDNTQWFEEIP